MSGQISGQVPNQAATQLPSLPQQNGNYVPSQMQNIGGLRGTCNMDQELPFMRRCIRERIYQFLQGQQTNHEMLPRLPDVAKRLEELLLKDASSKEEYLNMDSLEHRLQTLVRRFQSHNQTQHQQIPHLMSSTSSIGTMIPTPGMPHNGNTSSTIPSSGDNSLTSSTFAANTVNAGNLLATSNNGSSGLRGVSFNPSDGAVANGSQSPANISVGSGGNNMMSAMSVPRMSTQMIPTPGLNSPQSISVNSEYSNGGGFSSVESMVSQQHQHQHQQQQQQQLQQPKQYSGSQNSRILQGIGSQMGFGMRSNLQQKSSSYGFPNGAMNGRLQLIGNNIQLMNGSAAPESYLNASTYTNSPKPLPQQSDQQRHQQIMQTLPPQMILTGDMYGMNANDVSGSGNLYGPATSVGSTMNNQNVNHMNLQSKPKTNSGMLTNQPNLQTIQQLTHIKPQTVDQSSKMSYQSPHSTREQLMQTQQQMQKFQQQQIQQPQYSQFVEHQHQQKQQTQQHQQLLLKNDILREPQLSFNAGGQIIPEDGMEAHHESLQAQISEHYHLSEFQNQYQQKNAAPEDYSKGSQIPCHPSGAEDFHSSLSQTSHQMQQQQQMLHSHQQMVESQNDFSCVSSGSLQEALLQGQWHPQPLENFQHEQSHQPSAEQHIQEEFHQRITGRDEAQRPRFSSEGSLTTHTDVSKGAPQQASTEVIYRAVTVRHAQDVKKQQRWLHLLRHARRCPAPEGKCISACISVKKLWRHMESCSSRHCQFPRCHQSTILLEHHRNCRNAECPVCIPCHQFWARLESQFIPLLDTGGAAESVNGTWRNVDDSKLTTKNVTSTTKTPEDLQPSTKRTKMDNQSPSIIPKSESCPVPVAFGSQSHTLQLAQPLFQSCQEMEVCVPVRSEAMEVKIEQLSQCFRQVPSPAFADVKKDVLDGVHGAQPDVEPKIQNELYGHAKQDNILVKKEADQLKVEVKQDIAQPADQLAGTKSGKPKIKAVSMTELFTPEQVREHIKGLRQWVGQSRAKAEKNQAMENSMSENSCQLCAVEKLTFEPPPIYCTQCGARIKRNAMYYTMGTGDTRHYFCIPCYNEVRGDTIEADGAAIPKARLEKKRNDEETEEWWVQCDKCEAWQHQICALFNGRRNDGGQAEYTCPNCYIEEVERGERKPLPQSAVLGAKDLPRTILSDHIELRLARRLKQERHERARVQGKSVDEVPGAEALVIRVVSSVDKKLEVKQRFLEIFQDENYPVEFPYKSKVVLLFQKIEGVEVCLFGMYVQEFGSECQFPNQRRVYLSYLDSVKYFRPEIRTVTGEALRTFVYHEILIGYLEYCKKRGFTSCYIWACPPLKGEDYILYCHPEIQKTPKSDKLREWYLAMLRKAARENIVVDLTNLYDHFFIQVGESKAKVTAARLPYFDGDYWPGAAEDMINQLRQEEDGRKQQKKGKTKKTITKRALKAAGQADLSGNASKDALLMQKLGETICPMKEDFIMVHLQHACNHCCHLLVTGKRWACGQCKNFQLCNRCHEAEQKLEERERHPANNREKHSFTPVEINDVPADTKDKDEILESEFFDTRQAFLSLCQGNHYQYDTLRRAKHSSMMVLYHLHNPTAPAFVTTCNVCHHDIETGQGWRCEVCPDFDVCNACYQKTGGADHPHKLTNHPSTAERDAQNTEAREKRVLNLRIMLDLLVHASQCRFPHCKYPKCRQVKGLFRHGMQCRIRASGGCLTCKKMWYLLQLHARACKESECHVPRCKDLKEHMRRLQQQSDSRRRAAVMEMMRQRAAEVAGNSG